MIASVGRMMRKGGGGLSWPAGMKEHIKAWYDPKKQGMTNFGVIESYADDFTKWRIENTGVTSTQKKITSICCHGAIIVADRSFTEEEINWLKDNLFRK